MASSRQPIRRLMAESQSLSGIKDNVAKLQAQIEADKELRHKAELDRMAEMNAVRLQLQSVGSSLETVVKSVDGVVTGMTAQNMELQKLTALSVSVMNLEKSDKTRAEESTFIKQRITGILITMGASLILGLIGMVFFHVSFAEPPDAAIVHSSHGKIEVKSDQD